jgi:hypothetical protein
MQTNRTADGKLQADKKRFPNGIKALADYVSLPSVTIQIKIVIEYLFFVILDFNSIYILN